MLKETEISKMLNCKKQTDQEDKRMKTGKEEMQECTKKK
jgi:hypothetical protein